MQINSFALVRFDVGSEDKKNSLLNAAESYINDAASSMLKEKHNEETNKLELFFSEDVLFNLFDTLSHMGDASGLSLYLASIKDDDFTSLLEELEVFPSPSSRIDLDARSITKRSDLELAKGYDESKAFERRLKEKEKSASSEQNEKASNNEIQEKVQEIKAATEGKDFKDLSEEEALALLQGATPIQEVKTSTEEEQNAASDEESHQSDEDLILQLFPTANTLKEDVNPYLQDIEILSGMDSIVRTNAENQLAVMQALMDDDLSSMSDDEIEKAIDIIKQKELIDNRSSVVEQFILDSKTYKEFVKQLEIQEQRIREERKIAKSEWLAQKLKELDAEYEALYPDETENRVTNLITNNRPQFVSLSEARNASAIAAVGTIQEEILSATNEPTLKTLKKFISLKNSIRSSAVLSILQIREQAEKEAELKIQAFQANSNLAKAEEMPVYEQSNSDKEDIPNVDLQAAEEFKKEFSEKTDDENISDEKLLSDDDEILDDDEHLDEDLINEEAMEKDEEIKVSKDSLFDDDDEETSSDKEEKPDKKGKFKSFFTKKMLMILIPLGILLVGGSVFGIAALTHSGNEAQTEAIAQQKKTKQKVEKYYKVGDSLDITDAQGNKIKVKVSKIKEDGTVLASDSAKETWTISADRALDYVKANPDSFSGK